MVYLNLPTQLTDEEVMLQKKYQQLKKKKKALQQLKTPKPEPVAPAPKRGPDVKYDAKEVAKKLLKSGAISAIKVETKETQGFKRSKTLERRRNTSEITGRTGSNAVAGYQPFSSAHSGESEDDVVASSSPSTKPQVKNLYESFVSAQEQEEKPEPIRPPREHRERPPLPKQGNTIYCHGFGITEDILRKSLAPFGNIINVSMELDKNCGFVTFNKMDSAAKAISEMNGATVSNINLRVSLARRQPIIDQSSESNWSTIAASNSQKGSHRDSRDLVAYTENIF